MAAPSAWEEAATRLNNKRKSHLVRARWNNQRRASAGPISTPIGDRLPPTLRRPPQGVDTTQALTGTALDLASSERTKTAAEEIASSTTRPR